jgi:hypothetical protein
MIKFVKPPTDEEIRTYVYANTHKETSDMIEMFINGMKALRDIWVESMAQPYIYEKDDKDIVYKRRLGADPSTREEVKL